MTDLIELSPVPLDTTPEVKSNLETIIPNF